MVQVYLEIRGHCPVGEEASVFHVKELQFDRSEPDQDFAVGRIPVRLKVCLVRRAGPKTESCMLERPLK